MKISQMNIKDIGGIKSLNLSFNKGINLICGANGVGKTTILDCIAYSFGGGSVNVIKRNSMSQEGMWDLYIEEDGIEEQFNYRVTKFTPFEEDYLNGNTDKYNNVIVFKTHRDIPYTRVDSIRRDRTSSVYQMASEQNKNGVNSNEIKSWFINRYMWSAHEDVLDTNQKKNYQLAKDIFQMLDPQISFLKVNHTTNDILVKTPNGNIYYEYLSSGYKSCIHLLLGIIKEIEYRFQEPTIFVADYSGIILIDELDLHLHPEWQSKILNCLRETFKNAQIIASTHSPNMIQSAIVNEVIPLKKNTDGSIEVKKFQELKYGFQGWTIEEILEDVMGLQSTKSQKFNETLQEFNDALDNQDLTKAKMNYEILKDMINPNNVLLRLLTLQMNGMVE